ncbi:MAG: alpha/beta hydrolase [Ruminococcus sp.]|nr:alpha/beta hydrolase [Ruminococcus sp.]
MKKMKKVALGALTAAAVGGLGAYGVLKVIDNLLVDRKWTVPENLKDKISGADMSLGHSVVEKNRAWVEEYGYETITMVSDDGQTLSGYWMKPEKPSDVFAFCSHGYRSEGRREYSGISQYYLRNGYNVFLVDHVASGDSEGKIVGFGHYECRDCLKWLNLLTEKFGKDIKIIVHGISMGAATVMLMSGNENLSENVKMIVSDCGYTSAWDEFEYKLKSLKVPPHPLLELVNEVNKRAAGYDFKDTNALESVKKAKVPMLFIHGSVDDFVPTFMVYQVYEACGSAEKDLMVVEGADHAQSYVTNTEAYEAKLDEFISKYIETEATV